MPSDVLAKADGGKTAEIFAALPQTQCTRCGYPDCQAYANAIADEGAAINQCSPGGAEGIARLSNITCQIALPLNPETAIEGPRRGAFIDENSCIGCTLCIDACPTDAIIGSNKLLHTVIEPHCKGCELCIPVCPVDCIELENVTGALTGWSAWSTEAASSALNRYNNRYTIRSASGSKNAGYKGISNIEKAEEKLANLAEHSQLTDPVILDKKRAIIEAALAKARSKQGKQT